MLRRGSRGCGKGSLPFWVQGPPRRNKEVGFCEGDTPSCCRRGRTWRARERISGRRFDESGGFRMRSLRSLGLLGAGFRPTDQDPMEPGKRRRPELPARLCGCSGRRSRACSQRQRRLISRDRQCLPEATIRDGRFRNYTLAAGRNCCSLRVVVSLRQSTPELRAFALVPLSKSVRALRSDARPTGRPERCRHQGQSNRATHTRGRRTWHRSDGSV